MARPPSWQAVAAALAHRMAHHARCPQHPAADAVPDDCPWCADRAAYQLYLDKAGLDWPKPERHRTVSLTELRDRTEGPANLLDDPET